MNTPIALLVNALAAKTGELSGWTLLGVGLLTAAVLLNLKSLPFMWHIRIGHALFTHRNPPPDTARAGILFLPVLNHTSTPAADCDYNLHKSNSTYFGDLDLARVHLLGALGLASVLKQAPRPALGGVACNFRRPIAPYQRISIYTRVLTWDSKWLYLASWIVPRDSRASARGAGRSMAKQAQPGFTPDASTVYAVSVARYVFKQGRRTVPPASVLQNAGLLPAHSPCSESPPAHAPASSLNEGNVDSQAPREWNWDSVEQERRRGQAVASFMSSLETLQDDLRCDRLLGEFK